MSLHLCNLILISALKLIEVLDSLICDLQILFSLENSLLRARDLLLSLF